MRKLPLILHLMDDVRIKYDPKEVQHRLTAVSEKRTL